MSDAIIEAMAKAMWRAAVDGDGCTDEEAMMISGDDWHQFLEYANAAYLVVSAENAELKKAGKEVVDWWLRDGMNKFDGAPAAMFNLRAAIGETE